MAGGLAEAVAALQKRWGLTHHAAVHLLRVIDHVGGRTTSGRRTSAQNAAVGGAPRSNHLYGRAFDHVPGRRGNRATVAFIRRDRCGPACRGPIEVLDEGDHVHAAYL